MGKSYRIDKAAEDIKYALVEILRNIKDPRVSKLLSIIHLDLAGDLSQVKVYVSALEGRESTVKSVEGLKSAAGFIRRELATTLNLRMTPELTFLADSSISYGAHIASILNNLEITPEEELDADTDGENA
jgi:ribosome-binding factor A